MKVVILCGGQGTRLREQTEVMPKPMVEIGGRPMLWHIMKIYSHFGLTDFVLCLGYKGEVIKNYFANGRDENDWTVSLIETGQKAQTGPGAGTWSHEYIITSKVMTIDSR